MGFVLISFWSSFLGGILWVFCIALLDCLGFVFIIVSIVFSALSYWSGLGWAGLDGWMSILEIETGFHWREGLGFVFCLYFGTT
jgi:hypothetical protein